MTVPYQPTFSHLISRWLYSGLLAVVVPILLILSLVKRKTSASGASSALAERFGLIKAAGQGGYWFHCVSVGEVVAASSIVKRLWNEDSGEQIVITTTTATGAARVRDLFGDRVAHHYLPYDFSFAMLQLLKRLKPNVLVITEVELWPNMIDACWRRGVPAVVINARMTDRSARRYNKLSFLFQPMLNKLSHVCAQGERDYNNYLALGIPCSRLTLTNNIKFDQAVAANSYSSPFLGLVKGTRPILIGGSTHHPEENILIDTLGKLLHDFPSLLLILVPRHPQRFAGVQAKVASSGVAYCRSSEASVVEPEHNILLVDEMGKLNHAYSVADIAFVGGSLADKGGHNALEPAAFGLPVLMGPNLYNNPDICARLAECSALTVVNDKQALLRNVRDLIMHPEEAHTRGASGLKVLAQNGGAVEETLSVIAKVKMPL